MDSALRILALEPYYGGSHRAFLDGWVARSGHAWTVLTLPAYKWKWRMRHAAVTFAERAADLAEGGAEWDVLFCTDMLNLAEFVGLAPEAVRRLPRVLYFHENQLTYPVRKERERDLHFAFTNIVSALAADAVWFNTAWHRDQFLDSAGEFIRRMPDHRPAGAIAAMRSKSAVHPPGIESPTSDAEGAHMRRAGPLRILWAARWEHDKNPRGFFEAMRLLKAVGASFRLSVIGESFEEVPDVFESARVEFAEHIDRWGYQPDREAYRQALHEADVVVSTAMHEFFGLSVIEAMSAGVYPMVPDRLAYPEVLRAGETSNHRDFFYDGSTTHLAKRLACLSERATRGNIWEGDPNRGRRLAGQYGWDLLVPRMDRQLAGHARPEMYDDWVGVVGQHRRWPWGAREV